MPNGEIDGVVSALTEFGRDPFRRGLDVKKPHGKTGVYRFRLGKYRITYTIDRSGRTLDIVRIADRKDIYRS